MMVSRVAGSGGAVLAVLRRLSLAGLLLALALAAGAVSGADNSAFVSYSGVPTTMKPNGKASVTVTMLNTGTTTWQTTLVRETTQGTVTTTKTSFALRAVGHDWVVRKVEVTGSVAPNAQRGFQFTITAPSTPGTYAFQWRMVRDTVVVERPRIPASADWGFGATTPRKLIVVEADTAPTFGAQKIEFQDWLVGHAITPFDLPEASGGNGTLTYALTCYLPGGVSRVGKRISGAPRTVWGKTDCLWKASDSDANTAESDTAKLRFTIRARRAALAVSMTSLELEEVKEGEERKDVKEFEVKLDAKPTGPVKVKVTSEDPGAVGVDKKDLTFTADNYRRPRKVKATAKDDPDAADETTSISLGAEGGGYDGVSASVAVTVDDDDEYEPPIVVPKSHEPKSHEVIEGGDSKTFKVKLPTQPVGDVTVSVTSEDSGAVGVDKASLTFTTGNYGAWQEVKVAGLQDEDASDEKVDVNVVAKGDGYGGESLSSSVTVTVKDDDTRGIVVNPTKLKVDEGSSKTFTVKLATQPTPPKDTVTVAVKSGDTGAVSVRPSSLTFNADNYATAKEVTVAGEQDPDASGETAVISLDARGADYDGQSASVDVAVKDDDTRGIVVNPTNLKVDEGSSKTFTVKLATPPTGAVTVSVASGDTGAVSVRPSSLTFNADNYATTKEVTVAGEQDPDASDETAVISLDASGADYDGQLASVDVAVKDDDTRGIVVNPTNLKVDEGSSKTFTVKLATPPTGAVTVSVASGDAGAARVSPASLTFTTSNYGTARPVTVTGEQDADSKDESTRVSLSASGGGYGSESASVAVAVEDDDEPALVVAPGELAVTEGGAGKTFTVTLAAQPTGAVTVSVKSGDAGAASVSPPSLSFTAADYGTAREVTVTGVLDADSKDEETSVALSASGGGYGGVSASVDVTVDDKGEPRLVVDPAELAVTEGGFGEFTVALATQPTAAVTVSLSLPSAVADKVIVSPASLTFTAADYGTARKVTVSGEEDEDSQDESVTVALSASGGGYDDVSASVGVAVKDDDAPALMVSPTKLEVMEGGSGEFTVKLATRPSDTVTVSMSVKSRNGEAATVDGPAILTFTTADYRVAQVVPVPGAQDDDAEDEDLTVGLSASGGGYDGLSASVDVTVKDDDAPALVVDPASLGVAEGESAGFTVKLATAPADTVTVSVTSGDAGAATVEPASLTFTTADYGTTQRVTVTGAQDDDAQDEETSVALTASGGYDDVSASVEVRVKDDDARGLLVSPASLEVAEGESAGFTVKLATAPTDTVTVSVTSGDAEAATVEPASLTFTTADYGTAQEVTVTGVEDAEEKDRSATVALSASGGDYGGVAASASVTVTNVETSSDDASFVSQTGVPSTMVAGSSATVTVRMRNTGGTTWTSAAGYELASQRPADNATWGPSRVPLPSDLAPGGTVDFTFEITAPEKVGGHAFRWKMVRGAAGWFGEKTKLRRILVEEASSDDASFVSQTGVPLTMPAGSSATVTVRMRNTGTTTWTSAAGYQLGSQRPADNATWGLSRVPLPSDVAPGETVDFTFEITAPETAGGHKFRWKMVRGAEEWFGRKTALREIVVTGPSFGAATIPDQTWVKGEPIEALTLPEAIGADGALTYALTPSLPDGVTFTEATRMLSGTPTGLRAATEYAYTATDAGDDAATLTFSIKVEDASTDDAVFVSLSGLPSKIVAGGAATVTVTVKNTGTTTWTSLDGYALGSRSAGSKDTWGPRRAPLPGSVAPNESVAFTFPITAPETTGSYTFSWRMVRDPGGWFGSGTGDVSVAVEDPSFGDAAVPDQMWIQDTALESLTLPAASGGDGGLTYALTPAPPDGVSFTETTRTLAGTPTTAQAATEYAYTATDEDGDVATLVFSITVEAASRDDAAFVSMSGLPSRMAAGGTATVTVTMRNTGTTTWTSAGGYALGSQSPGSKDTWGPRRAPLPGSVAPNESVAFEIPIAAPETTGSYTFSWRMVRDPGRWFGSGTGDVSVTVEDPSFGDAAIPDQTWIQGTALQALTLPAASGGDGGLTYALTPAPPAGVSFAATTRVLSGTPSASQAGKAYTYAATDEDGDAATLAFTITVSPAASAAQSSTALAPGVGEDDVGASAPSGVFDMFEYWLLPHGSGVTVRARLGDGRLAPAGGPLPVRSFWRGELWGRRMALAWNNMFLVPQRGADAATSFLGDPGGGRYDIFEEVADGLDYWGAYEGGAGGGEDRPSRSLDRPFRWMNRFMAVGDAVESPVTGHLLSNRGRNRESVVEATMRLEILSHRASFTIPVVDGPTFQDVLAVRFWPDVTRPEAHDTFHLARGFGAVHWRRSAIAAPSEVVEWWAVENSLAPVAPSAPSVPWFDPFSPGWPKTAVLNGNLEDFANGVEGTRVGSSAAPAWTADSADAVIARTPSGLAGGAWSLLLRGSDGGGDAAADEATTGEWIPVEGGTYQLSACMLRESAADNVLVDFDDGIGRDADFADAHLVATSTGAWECRAVTKCIPGSVGAVRIRAARDGANLGDAWFDRIELKRIAACAVPPGNLSDAD